MDILTTTGSIIALTTGLTEVFKRALKLSKGVVPLIAVVLGIFLTLLLSPAELSYAETILLGIATGLSSIGLFSGTKNVLGK